MGYFEKMLGREQQKVDEKGAYFRNAKIQQQEDLKELCDKLNAEEIPAYKSDERVFINLPVGYFIIDSSVTSPAEGTQFSLKGDCEIELPVNTINSVDHVIQKVKIVLENLAKHIIERKAFNKS